LRSEIVTIILLVTFSKSNIKDDRMQKKIFSQNKNYLDDFIGFNKKIDLKQSTIGIHAKNKALDKLGSKKK